MPKNVREFQLNNVTGELYTEYDDNSTDTVNLAADLPAIKSAFVIDPVTGVASLAQFVISTDAPDNADGRPDGTIYFQVI